MTDRDFQRAQAAINFLTKQRDEALNAAVAANVDLVVAQQEIADLKIKLVELTKKVALAERAN